LDIRPSVRGRQTIFLDLVRIGLRLVHALSAALWVGGSLFYLFVLNPSFASSNQSASLATSAERLRTRIGATFRHVMKGAVGLFVVTGAVLAVDRVSQPGVTTGYMGTLAVHVALSGAMFWMVMSPRRIGATRKTDATMPLIRGLPRHRLLLALGLLAYLTAIIMKVIVEHSITAAS